MPLLNSQPALPKAVLKSKLDCYKNVLFTHRRAERKNSHKAQTIVKSDVYIL